MSERDKAIEEARTWLSKRNFVSAESVADFAIRYHAKQNAEKLAKLEAFVNGLEYAEWGDFELEQVDGEWLVSQYRNAAGHLMVPCKTFKGKTPAEAIYAYLEQGRGRRGRESCEGVEGTINARPRCTKRHRFYVRRRQRVLRRKL